jgi:hypothetical protein
MILRHFLKNFLKFSLDSYGDTALHDAIGKENHEVVEMLCKVNTLDLTIRNKRGNCRRNFLRTLDLIIKIYYYSTFENN